MKAPITKLVIVIVNWNTAGVTMECLRSLSDTDCLSRYQTVVIDNASSDDSCAQIESEFGKSILQKNSENFGFAAANNQVINSHLHAAEYFLLLNSDTIVLADVIHRSVAYMDSHSEVGAMGCRVLNTDRSVQLTCSGFPTPSSAVVQLLGLERIGVPALQSYRMEHWDRSAERDVEVVSGCYLLLRSSVIEEIGVLDEEFFFFGEETDWCWRMKKAGWVLRFAPVGEIVHHGSVSARKLDYRRDLLLSNALVRFNVKNRGRVSGVLMFVILFLFNASRAFGHALLAPFRSSSHERAIHFFRVMMRFRYAWSAFKSKDLMNI